MLTSTVLRRRVSPQACAQNAARSARHFAHRNGRSGSRRGRREAENQIKSDAVEKANKHPKADKATPSLFEQLFPDQEAALQQQQEREVPRIPLEDRAPPVGRLYPEDNANAKRPSKAAVALRQEMESLGERTTALVLRNASKNLLEEDFRRLIPKGQHMEGWTMEQGDIVKVIPGRDWQTLEQENWYYILFSSPLSAFTYQGHVTRVHRIVAQHTPSNILSAMLPPPGYLVKGMDANEAIESFSLVPPNQALDLRQLKPPLTPFMEYIIQNGGYGHLLKRKDRMPYEARLTLEGPQLHLTHIRHILLLSGKDRGLGWSGGSEATPRVTEWDTTSQFTAPSPMSNKPDAVMWGSRAEMKEVGKDRDESPSPQDRKQRTPKKVFIIGFHTENAMQSFVRFWHRRPVEWEGWNAQRDGDEEGDLAPIAHVDVLW